MSELRVPTNPIEVEITCVDGRSFAGTIFVPVYSHRHSGSMKVEEWLQENTSFFALLFPGQTTPLLLNKHQVLILISPANELSAELLSDPLHESLDDENSTERSVPRKRVEVVCNGHPIVGELIIDMPSSQSRVIDYLNRDEEFLSLRIGSHNHFIRKRWITSVLEKARE